MGKQIVSAIRKKYEWEMSRWVTNSEHPQLVYWGEDPKGTTVFVGCFNTNEFSHILYINYSIPEKVEVESNSL